MSIIYLKHPVHGQKVATMELEARHDESRGWVRYNPSEIAPHIEAPAQEPSAEAVPNAMNRRRRKDTSNADYSG